MPSLLFAAADYRVALRISGNGKPMLTTNALGVPLNFSDVHPIASNE
jgi:hypothetical protein